MIKVSIHQTFFFFFFEIFLWNIDACLTRERGSLLEPPLSWLVIFKLIPICARPFRPVSKN